MNSQPIALANQHGENIRLVANNATLAGADKRTYERLCLVCENFLVHKPTLARIIRLDQKAPVAIRQPMVASQHHTTAEPPKDGEAISRRMIE